MALSKKTDHQQGVLDTEIPGTQSIGRAVQVLRAVAANGRCGSRLEDIVSRTMLSKTTCVRVLNRLLVEQMIRRHGQSGKYFLGPLLDELGMLARPEHRLADTLDPFLQRLADFTQDTVYLSEKSGLDAVCTAVKLGGYPIKVVPLDTGVRRPLGVAAGGVALLAGLPPHEAENIMSGIGVRYARHEGLTREKVAERLIAARQLGFALAPSYGAPGAVSLSMPLPSEFPPASITVTALKSRMESTRQEQIVDFMKQLVAGLGNEIPEGEGSGAVPVKLT